MRTTRSALCGFIVMLGLLGGATAAPSPLAGSSDLAATNAAGAAQSSARPFRYIVMEEDGQGGIRPVFERQVMLREPQPSLERAAADRMLAETPRGKRRYEVEVTAANGAMEYLSIAESTDWIRAEFDRGGGEIEGHRVRTDRRQFVVRIPAGSGEKLEVRDPAGGTGASIDLADLGQQALPLEGVAPAAAPPPPGNPLNRVDLLVMGDGYRADQAGLFSADVAELTSGFFSITPYAEYANFVNVTQLFTPSAQAGADHPPYNAGCGSNDPSCCGDPLMQSDPLRNTFVNTAFNARYCSFNIHRAVTVDNGLVYAAASAVPEWDQIIVLVNDPTYGGTGGGVSVFSTTADMVSVAQHEHGHSFTDLADEYDDPNPGFPSCTDLGGGTPCEANVTDQTVRALLKWAPWVAGSTPLPTPEDNPAYSNVVGLFQGARYQPSGMYRSGDRCLMRFLYTPFCQVASQAYVHKLYGGGWGTPWDGIDLIEPGSESPAPGNVPPAPSITFSFTPLQPVGGPPLTIRWYVDSVLQPETSASFTLADATNPHTVEAHVGDPAPLVHPAMRDSTYESSRTWSIGASLCDVPNDNRADAILVDPDGPGPAGCSVGATMEPGEASYCGAGSTLWYAIQPDRDGLLSLSAYGFDFDTTLAIYDQASPPPAEPVFKRCNNDPYFGGTDAHLEWPVSAGGTYYVQLGGLSGAAGTFALSMFLGSPCLPFSDDQGAVTPIIAGREEGQCNYGATVQPGEPAPCGSVSRTVWYRITSNGAGTMTVTSLNSDFDTVLAAYTAMPPPGGGGSLLACNDDAAPPERYSTISFPVTTGGQYYIQGGGYGGDEGSLRVRASCNFDADCDNVLVADNCEYYNPSQVNTDNGPWITPGRPNDVTIPYGDPYNAPYGAPCDWDSDNDHVLDFEEPQNVSPPGWPRVCPLSIPSMDPANPDTDGDRVIDGAECRLGSDPTSAASKPVKPPAADDNDRDWLPNAFEIAYGFDPDSADGDGDGVPDGFEYRGYGTSPADPDSDYDNCPDGIEIASVNHDTSVNIADFGIIKAQAGPGAVVADLTKDGTVNVNDLAFAASNAGHAPVTRCGDPIPVSPPAALPPG